MERINPLGSDPNAANANLSDPKPGVDNWQGWLDRSAIDGVSAFDGPGHTPPVTWSSSYGASDSEWQADIGFDEVVRRLFARAIDIGTWCFLFAFAVLAMIPFELNEEDNTLATALATYAAIILLEWICRSRTLGKLLAGLRMVDAGGHPIRWKQSSLRVLLLMTAMAWLPVVGLDRESSDSSTWPLIGGLLVIFCGGLSLVALGMVVFSKRRRAPWDMIARSQVRRPSD